MLVVEIGNWGAWMDLVHLVQVELRQRWEQRRSSSEDALHMIISRFEIWIFYSLAQLGITTMLPHHHHGNQPTYTRSTQTDDMDRRQEGPHPCSHTSILASIPPFALSISCIPFPSIMTIRNPQANKPLHREKQVSSPWSCPWTGIQAQIQQWRHSP